jgi:hypothetical protein
MMLALEILGGWFALSLLLHSILAPWLAGRFAKHDEWVEQQEMDHRATAPASASIGHRAAGRDAS